MEGLRFGTIFQLKSILKSVANFKFKLNCKNM